MSAMRIPAQSGSIWTRAFCLAGLVVLSLSAALHAQQTSQQEKEGTPEQRSGQTEQEGGTPTPLAAVAELRGEIAEQPTEGQAPTSSDMAKSLDWESQARLHHGLGGLSGTLTLGQDGVVFRPTKGSPLHWPFLEIETFDLLSPRRLVITGYGNRSWHRHGERKYRFDLSAGMPPEVAAELARRVAKPVRNGNPEPNATSFATISARHRTLAGGTNGTLRFGPDGIDYITMDGKGGRAWRWSDIETLANPDPFHLRVNSYLETFVFELKQAMSPELFDRLWNEIYAHDANRGAFSGPKKNP